MRIFGGGGLKKTTTYSTAYNNATSFILIILTATLNGYNYNFSFVIPKDMITSSETVFLNGAAHQSNAWYVTIGITSSIVAPAVYHNNSGDGITKSLTYYYD